MTWICPKCSRKFKNNNQSHDCTYGSVEQHLAKSNKVVQHAAQVLLAFVQKLGPVQISSVKSGILVAGTANFLSIKPKKERLEVEFLLKEEITEFPVYRTFRVSKTKVAHYISIDSATDLDALIKGWIKKAYLLHS